MTTIVRNKETGGSFLLLGGGYGAYQSSTPGVVGHKISGGELQMVLVTNAAGEVGWFKSTEVEVISVDGVSPAHALRPQDRHEGL